MKIMSWLFGSKSYCGNACVDFTPSLYMRIILCLKARALSKKQFKIIKKRILNEQLFFTIISEIDKPTQKQISDACFSADHSYGLMDEEQRKVIEFAAQDWLYCWKKAFESRKS